jgi:hypothetical protein
LILGTSPGMTIGAEPYLKRQISRTQSFSQLVSL